MTGAVFTVRCPGCGATSRRVPAHLAGRPIRCASCGARFTAPVPAPSPPPAPAAPVEPQPAPTVPETPEVLPTLPDTGAEAPTRADAEAADATRGELGADAATRLEGRVAPSPSEAPPAAAPRPGGVDWKPGDVVLGLYEVVGVLGQGGMGRVYRVRHRGWGLDLAVKVPLPEVLQAAGGADPFEREAETWVNLGLHPHVATCYYVRRVSDLPLVFAELVDGGSLLDAIRQRRLISLETILDVAVQAAWGLHHAHEQGLVHRDVKPANVLLTAGGDAKVTDFGLARGRPGSGVRIGGEGSQTVTVEGGGGGTPAYLSPEQAAGGAMSRRSDVWSFALTVLEMFLGRRSWEYGLAAPEVLGDYRSQAGPAPGLPRIPEPVAALLERCFREAPDERPRGLGEVAAVLRAAWEDAAGRPYPRREPRGGRESADGWNNRAVSLVDLGRGAEARTLWRRALEAEPQHVEATHNAGLAAWTAGHLDDAELLRRAEDACTSHASSSRAHQLLGRIRRLLGDETAAGVSFARARDLGATDDLARDAESSPPPPGGSARGWVLRGLPGPAVALALAPDGHTVIAAGGPEARVWDTTSGALLKTMVAPEGAVRAVLPLPDGRFLVVAAEKAPLTVWDLLSGQRVKAWARHPGFATCLALLPGGRLAVSGGSDRMVRLWDVASGRCVTEMGGHEEGVSAVSGGQHHVVSAARDGTVRLWAVADGRPLAVLRGHEGRVNAVALSEADSRVLSAGEDGTVRDWGLHSHELVRAYTSHAGAVHALALGPGSGRAVSGAADRTVRGWDLDGERLSEWQQLDAAVHALALAADGTVWAAHGTAVSALAPAPLHRPPPVLCRPSSAIEVESRAESFEQRLAEARRTLTAGDLTRAASLVRNARAIPGHERSAPALALWDELCARLPRKALRSAWEEGRLTGHTEPPLAVATGPSDDRALTGSLDGGVRLFDLGSRRLLVTLTGHAEAVNSVAFVGSSPRAVSGGRDRTVRVWDLGEGRLVRTLEGHGENVTSVDASPDGRVVASGSWDGTVRLWDLASGSAVHVLQGHEAHVAAVCCAADGQAVASAGWDGTVRLWETANGELLSVLPGHEGNVTAVALHPSGRSVASGGEDGTVRVWDPRTRRPARTLRGHGGEVTGLCFTPDGSFLVSSGRDHTVRLWDLRRGEPVRTLPHATAVYGVALTLLGNGVLAATADRDVHAWHLDWEPEEQPATGWDETARPFLETHLRRRRPQTSAPEDPAGLSDAEVDGVVSDLQRRGFGSLTRETVRSRLGTLAPHRADVSHWDSLRRAGPGVARGVPRAAGAVRRVPWLRVGLGAAALGAVAVGIASWWTPEPRVALSPYMQRAVRAEIDLIDLQPFSADCRPDSYGVHLDRLYSGAPEARDVACLATLGGAGTVADVLDGAPLSDAEPIRTSRLVRNAASALAGLPSPGLDALCPRLGDPRAEVSRVAGIALAEAEATAAVACVRDTLQNGSPSAKAAAVIPFRQLLARGALGPAEGWALVQGLLRDESAEARAAGLRSVSMFAFSYAEPATRPLLEDPDPTVAEAAGAALRSIETVHRADLLAGHADP